jgi:hypothetical protein
MTSIKGHFDGTSIVLDEPPPRTLAVGQVVSVIVETAPPANPDELRRRADEALKPAREAFAASGMTDDELAEFLEVEKHAMRGVPYDHHE